jgi:hypothetical protein
MKIKSIIVLFGCLSTLMCATGVQAAIFTATASSNWSLGATWGNSGNNVVGSGVPGSADAAVIPASLTVTYDNSAPVIAGTVDVSGSITISKSGGTFGDFNINSGGTFSFGGQVPVTFSGNFTNNGSMNISGQSQTALTTYSGTGKVISGNVTNQIANITGSYTNLGILFVAANAQNGNLQGSGSLVNLGTIISKGSSAVAAGLALDCSAAGNTFRWTDVNVTPTPKATTYYNLILGNQGTAGWNLNGSGLTISGNLTITNVGGVSSWPANNVIGGTLIYKASSGTAAAAFPTVFSIGGLNQTSGKLTIPASGTLMVTGTGAGTWTITSGTFAQSSSSTVKFTGAAPGFSGVFANLIIDSTAANASVTALAVTNTLTINSGASLDVTALTTYTLSVTQSVLSAGTIVGSIDTAANSKAKIYAGTDGGFGTNTITGNLTLNATNSVNLDVNSTAAAANDRLVVGGTLTLNSTVFNLKAPSAGASIDTADYTLATAGSISGTPVLNWVTGFVPANTNNYVLVVSGGTVKLHNTGGVPAGSPTLTLSNSGGTLTLSWDSATFPGYSVQAQTNSASAGLGTNWIDTGSGTVSPYTPTIDPANSTVFYRLAHP